MKNSFKTLLIVCVLFASTPLFAQSPTPVIVTDKNGNSLQVTGATSGTQVGAPTPVVLTDKSGNALVLGAGNSSGGTNAIYATAYGLPATGFYSCVAAFTNVSQTMTTDATVDVTFTSAMVGWSIFLTNGPCQGQNGQTTGSVLFTGTISSINNAHSIQLSGTPTGTCAGSQAGGVSCRAYWFPSDSATALNAAWAAATAFRSQCATLVLPAGVYKFNTAIVSTTNCGPINSLITGTAFNGPSAQGQSMNGTILVADPNFDATSCTPGCVFGLTSGVTQSLTLRDFTVTGGGNATVSNGNGKCKVASPGWPSSIENVQLDYWGYATSGFTGLCWNGTFQGQSFVKNVNVYNGGYACASFNGPVTVIQLMCFTPAGSSILLGAGTTETYGSTFDGGSAGGYALTVIGCASYITNSMWNSYGDQINSSQNNGAINDSQSCQVNLYGDTVTSTHLNNIEIGGTSAGTLFASGSILTSSGGANNIASGFAGSVFTDGGGNHFTGSVATSNLIFNPNPTSIYPSAIAVGATGTGACATITTIAGNPLAGRLTCTGTSGAATIILTPGPTAKNGWTCSATDKTTPADVFTQSADSQTTCTLSATALVQNDVIRFNVAQQ